MDFQRWMPTLCSECSSLEATPPSLFSKVTGCQELRTLFPHTAFKNAPNPKFVQILSRRFFFGVPIRGTQICQKFVKNLKICPEIVVFQIFDKFLRNLGPPDWNPEKNRRDKFWTNLGVRGVFECCKGKKGSQVKRPRGYCSMG